jgi:hypothetical protein
MDDITVPDRLVGVDHVADLRYRHADPVALGAGQDPPTRDRTGGVAGGEQEYIVTGILETTGQLVDDQLDPSV